jgi:radical SAM protein with 4Fe4S-binding SPASM domain
MAIILESENPQNTPTTFNQWIFRRIPVRFRRIYLDFKYKIIKKRLKKYSINTPLFCHVQIETVSTCNNDCSFCPVNINARNREYSLMPLEIIEKLLRELGEIEYSELIELYSNNEPLIDSRMPTIIKMARQYTPKATIRLSTNGILLNLDRFKCLMDSGLSVLSINNYNDQLELNPPVARFINNFKKSDYFNNYSVIVNLRYKNAVLSTRGGGAPNKKTMSFHPDTCFFPFIQFCVNYKGDVFLCCADALWKKVVGNVVQNNILEIWNSEPYKNIRHKIATSGRASIQPCSECDVSGMSSVEVKNTISVRGPRNRFIGKAEEVRKCIN